MGDVGNRVFINSMSGTYMILYSLCSRNNCLQLLVTPHMVLTTTFSEKALTKSKYRIACIPGGKKRKKHKAWKKIVPTMALM